MQEPTSNTENVAIDSELRHSILLNVLARKPEWQTLGRAVTRKQCHCQNFELDDKYIIKLFYFPTRKPPKTRWWHREDHALAKLNGKLGSPITYGYIETGHDTNRTAILVREKVTGHILGETGQDKLTQEQCEEVGAMLAQFHNASVVTRDCHLDNLLVNTNETLSFIDFGKAATFPKKNLAFYFQAGWDLWKAKWRCTRLDPQLSKTLLNSYWQNIDGLPRQKLLYRLMQWVSNIQQGWRLFKRKFRQNP